MTCKFCGAPAGWLRRTCPPCSVLWETYRENRSTTSAAEMGRAFRAAGATEEQIEAFLDSDPDGSGSIRDRIAAEMANQLLEALGRLERKTPRDVERLRKRGLWRSYDQRPPE